MKSTIPKQFIFWFKGHFIDTDTIDLAMEYDRKITIDENKTIFMDKFANLFVEGKAELNEKAKEILEERKQLEFTERKEQIERDFNIKIGFVR